MADGDSPDSTNAGASAVLPQISNLRQRFEGFLTDNAGAFVPRPGGVTPIPPPTIVFPAPAPPNAIRTNNMYGRDDDKERIVQLLLSPPPRHRHAGQRLPIIPVIGEGGIGKTTLCWAVYTDPRIYDHFECRFWASISQQRLAQDPVVGRHYCREVDYLPCLFDMNLANKRFLLVVDDMDPEDLGFWKSVHKELTGCSRGSQVLLTSRTVEHLAEVVAESPSPALFRLPYLTDESSMSLLKDYAFGGRDSQPSSSPKAVGEEEAAAMEREVCLRACKGSPLLLRMMGALLQSVAAPRMKFWQRDLQSSCLKSDNKATPHLVLGFCFRRLPSHLRRCLLYCALFPRGYPFTRDQLVRLWMAEDFVPPAEQGKQMEDVGNAIVDELRRCSFLVHPPIGKQCLVMPSPVHAFVRSYLQVSATDGVEEICMDVRHSCLLPRSNCNREIQLTSCSTPVNLKSYLLVKSWGHDGEELYLPDEGRFRLQIPGAGFFLSLGHLSSLDLSFSNVVELPESVGMLRHLRYLSLNYTYIKELPESMSTLRSLWTLELRSCSCLRVLPRGFNKLTSLRHLDLLKVHNAWYPLSDIRELTNLQTLTSFTVGRGKGRSTSTIGQLKHLRGLRGELQINGVGRVLFVEEAEEAKLWEKEHIEKLSLGWAYHFTMGESKYYHDHEKEVADPDHDEGDSSDDMFDLFDDVQVERKESEGSRRERLLLEERERRWFKEEVFESLRPHPKLRHLVVDDYYGVRLPSWLGDPSLCNLVSLTLTCCIKCRPFPPGLGRLPSLKRLTISFFGWWWRVQDGSEMPEPIILEGFSSLEEMEVEHMPWWEGWCGLEGGSGGPLRLRSLSISYCDRLKRLPQCLPSLEELTIEACPKLTGLPVFGTGVVADHSPPELPALRRLAIDDCSTEWDKSHLFLLRLHAFPGLRYMEIRSCAELRFSPDGLLPPTLIALRIERCPLLRDWCMQQTKLAAVPWITLDGEPYRDHQADVDAEVAAGVPPELREP